MPPPSLLASLPLASTLLTSPSPATPATSPPPSPPASGRGRLTPSPSTSALDMGTLVSGTPACTATASPLPASTPSTCPFPAGDSTRPARPQHQLLTFQLTQKDIVSCQFSNW